MATNGWYLEANFTISVTGLLPFMPVVLVSMAVRQSHLLNVGNGAVS
jgi:hypothetical protein